MPPLTASVAAGNLTATECMPAGSVASKLFPGAPRRSPGCSGRGSLPANGGGGGYAHGRAGGMEYCRFCLFRNCFSS